MSTSVKAVHARYGSRPGLSGDRVVGISDVMLGELLNLLLLPFELLLGRVSGRGASPDKIKRFYKSVAWKRLRYAHLAKSPACLTCGSSAKDGGRMNVDHVKPLHRHWHLRLAPGNLQTLCALCNHGKGGTEKDWRGKR